MRIQKHPITAYYSTTLTSSTQIKKAATRTRIAALMSESTISYADRRTTITPLAALRLAPELRLLLLEHQPACQPRAL